MDNEKIKKTLKSVGLTKNEISVYLALLKLGSSRVGIISKEAQTNRSYTYDALKKLLEKGLVSYALIGKMKYFRSVSPKRLISLLKEREDDISEIMPHLKGLYKQQETDSNIRLYHGIKGVQTVLMNIVEEGKTNHVFGSEAQVYQRMPTFAKHFVKELESKKIKIKHIVRRGIKVKPSKTTELRFIPKKRKYPVATNIFGDKIVIIIWSEVPEAVLIHNKAAAESYRNYFDMLWNSAKKS